MVKEAMGHAIGPSQFSIETEGGCDLLHWALQITLKHDKFLAAASIDGINAYGDIERDCNEANIQENPYLHHLLPLFDMFY